MPRFDRYLLAQLTVLFGFFALVLVSVYWVNRGVSLFDDIIGDGQSALVFLEFAALTLPNVIRLVLPIAAFAATVYVINRLTNESELVVMQALGCSPWRLARPVAIFGLLVAIPICILTHFLVPASRAQLDLRQAEISSDFTARFLSAGQFLHPAGGITVFIRDITRSGELKQIYLSDATSPGTRVTYTANRAFLVQSDDGPKLVMVDGMAQWLREEDRRLSTATFDDFAYDISALIGSARIRRPSLDVMSTRDLLFPSPELIEAAGKPKAVFLYEGHARTAQGLLAVAGALIGYGALMVGGFSRFGLGRQIGLAITLLIAVNFLNNTAAGFAQRDESYWPVTYLPPLAGIGIGLGLIWLSAMRHRRRRPRQERPA
ncbi:LPS export ABC transporter permease LptF [Rhodovulum sulfidophilum]|uniref:LPS export ABC transporter permease LptF n=1 Tax=Rhodovulum sulfidophilum TaxID=35806 RepID=UPI001923FDE6|nr:LPS export ABC transporter permease LptF [Rhodovulum sulfidophilum]MBL3561004.1 LPS export ABC transporter permease LptF [Rhodovulum sulfidophilum]MCE8438782.1 LPS export ABC transporter permease LptF [Rhodovulum sulfidophilum]MCE8469319.1 LPS export ABC transporter permease LptF [Rhodovulum sulfidophilum]